MTERKIIKRKIAKLKSYRKNLPRLIDCSNVYGDNFFSEDEYEKIDKEIAILEAKIIKIDNT